MGDSTNEAVTADDVLAVVMAGGQSERMRTTAGPAHKALVRVAGVSLLERNLNALIANGFRTIAVTVSRRDAPVIEFVENQARELARAHHASVRCFVEPEPLGNMGAVRELSDGPSHLLVVYVDNVSTFHLRNFFTHHVHRRAALTIATHFESFTTPFGELEVRDGDVVSYAEKPARRVRIASGFYAVEGAALAAIPRGRLDAAGLFRRLSEAGRRISAFDHDSAWVDVNDAAALARAERLVTENPRAFASVP